jgi:Domain of unknown function (DUF4062)
MPDKETILKVFVSSPSDVKDERSAVVEIIEEINNAWATFLGIRLEAIRWETHCRPGVGNDSQQVINEQLPTDCEIYLGILWQRFGTPTPRFESGTEEEFQNAYERHAKKSVDVSVMFYFKNEPVPPTEIDTIQLGKLNEFRKKLGPKGVLHWEFESTGEFRQLIRMHLSQELQKWSEKLAPNSQMDSVNPKIDLESLRLRSDHYASEVHSLLDQAIASLDCFQTGLTDNPENSVADMANNLILATASYCESVENLANGFTQKIEEAVEAWVDLCMAELLLGGSKSEVSRRFLGYIKELADLFSKQARRYSQPMLTESELSIVPFFRASENRLRKVHLAFATELKSATKILREAQRITAALVVKRTSKK